VIIELFQVPSEEMLLVQHLEVARMTIKAAGTLPFYAELNNAFSQTINKG
jgi:hypothetical protein